MQHQQQTWIPLSPATARMWGLQAITETRRPRRRLMPALRRAAAAFAPQRGRRLRGAPSAHTDGHAPATAASSMD